jgi:hypothetical protein
LTQAAARFAGSTRFFSCFDPGACAPGFILPPASRAPRRKLTARRFTTNFRCFRRVRGADEGIKPGAQAPASILAPQALFCRPLRGLRAQEVDCSQVHHELSLVQKSPRSGRRHKAWGASPRINSLITNRARRAGDSLREIQLRWEIPRSTNFPPPENPIKTTWYGSCTDAISRRGLLAWRKF